MKSKQKEDYLVREVLCIDKFIEELRKSKYIKFKNLKVTISRVAKGEIKEVNYYISTNKDIFYYIHNVKEPHDSKSVIKVSSGKIDKYNYELYNILVIGNDDDPDSYVSPAAKITIDDLSFYMVSSQLFYEVLEEELQLIRDMLDSSAVIKLPITFKNGIYKRVKPVTDYNSIIYTQLPFDEGDIIEINIKEDLPLLDKIILLENEVLLKNLNNTKNHIVCWTLNYYLNVCYYYPFHEFNDGLLKLIRSSVDNYYVLDHRTFEKAIKTSKYFYV